MRQLDALDQAIGILGDLEEDSTLPRNLRASISSVREMLQDDSIERSIRIDNAMHALEDLSSDANIESYARTQLYQVTSTLEHA